MYTPIHLSIFTTFTTTCMYSTYLQSTMRYRHSRIHTTDPRRVVVGCSLPPSLPHAKRKYTNIPYLTSVLVPPYLLLLYYYVHIQVQYIREGTIMYTVSLYLSADERALTLISVIRAKIPRYIHTLPYLHHTCVMY